MFGLRCGINRSLDLRSSLVPIGFEGFLGSSREVAATKRIHGEQPFDSDGHREKGTAVDPWESKAGDLDPPSDAVFTTPQTPAVNNPGRGPRTPRTTQGTRLDHTAPRP